MTKLMANNNEQLINKIVYLMQNDSSFDAPADSLKWAKNVFRTRIVSPEKSIVQKIIAVLKMDLLPSQTVFGERSASGSAVRQMLFEAGEHKIDLRISKNEEFFTLRAQILGEGFENASVSFGNYQTVANELSEFEIASIVHGEYTLEIRRNEREIIVGKIIIN